MRLLSIFNASLLLSFSLVSAWQMLEYDGFRCTSKVTVIGGAAKAACTNFDVESPLKRAGSVKYTGATPASTGGPWLFDLTVFSEAGCSGHFYWISKPDANKCIEGPWKSWRVNTHVALGAADEISPVEAEEQGEVNPREGFSRKQIIFGGGEEDVSISDIEDVQWKNPTCNGRAYTKDAVDAAILRASECAQSTTCRDYKPNGTPKAPYPHYLSNTYHQAKYRNRYVFPIMESGSTYSQFGPGKIRVLYAIENNAITYKGLVRHPSDTNNDYEDCT